MSIALPLLVLSVLVLLVALALLQPASVDGRSRAAIRASNHLARRHTADPINPVDLAATHAYLAADYAYAQALLANAKAAGPALEGFANVVEGECPNVLAHAPRLQLSAAHSTPRTARAFGEERLHERQLERLRSELNGAAALAYDQPFHASAGVFANAISSLHWSNPAITQLVHQHANALMQQLQLPLPSICEDLRAWAASDYRTLSVGTKQFLRTVRAARSDQTSGPSIRALLKSYERTDEEFVKQIKVAAAHFASLLPKAAPILQRLVRTLGFPLSFEEDALAHIPKRNIVKIGSGHAGSGGEKVHPLPHSSHPEVHFLPGGLRALLHITVPGGGPTFVIIGQHYRFLGHIYFEPTIQLQRTARNKEEVEEGDEGSQSSTIFVGSPGHVHRPQLFSMQQETGCQPHPYAIVYGLLKPPATNVLAQLDGSTVTLHRLPIPASDHTRGTLVYAVLSTLPERLLIRSARGRTLYSESFGSSGKEAIETCEGESES